MRNAETTLAIIEDRGDRVKIDEIGSPESRILGNG
jgi:hypothetical protein